VHQSHKSGDYHAKFVAIVAAGQQRTFEVFGTLTALGW
jgi:hypothetical protein